MSEAATTNAIVKHQLNEHESETTRKAREKFEFIFCLCFSATFLLFKFTKSDSSSFANWQRWVSAFKLLKGEKVFPL